MSRWLTLGDLRLAALRVALAAALPLLFVVGVGAPPSVAVAVLSFAGWSLGPCCLAERSVQRSGAGQLKTALVAAVVGGLSLPIAVLQAAWAAVALEAGGVAALAKLATFPPELALSLTLLGAASIGGATFLFLNAPDAEPRLEPAPVKSLLEGLFAIAALLVGLPLLACYAAAALLDQRLGGASAAP